MSEDLLQGPPGSGDGGKCLRSEPGECERRGKIQNPADASKEDRAEGAFTNEERIVLLIMVSKYEVNRLRGLIRRHDPRAFIVVNEGVNVDGHFIKKLT